MKSLPIIAFCVLAALASTAVAQVTNVKVLTDATPDYHDLPAMVRSITARWPTPQEKCWAVFYWNHKARRQTSPMVVHGLAVTDPIRQFNDYGYTMCSTISGMNCAIWDAMGLPARYWDIGNHTVAEVFYDGRWHMYDSSMSAIFTLCDGETIASVEEIGAAGACAASGGEVEMGHIARYHCLNATSAHGFLTGSDTSRTLAAMALCFHPNVLKYRSYFYDWDRGHRYILNLRPDEVYTRYYQALGDEPQHFVPNRGRDPEVTQYGSYRFRIRGNGRWVFRPDLSAEGVAAAVHSLRGVQPAAAGGLEAEAADAPGEVVFKVDGANVISALSIRARLHRQSAADTARILVSTTNGRTWQEVHQAEGAGTDEASVELIEPVSGAYEVLVKVELSAAAAGGAALRAIELETLTMLNSKTQPRLNLGKNTVFVDTGEPAGSIVVWPDLRGDRYRPYVVEEQNIATQEEHPGYMGAMHAARPDEEAYVVFRIDAPHDITRLHYGGRLYNRARDARIDFLHSFDEGRTWTRSYSLTDTDQPWDVIHYESVDEVPPGTRSALVKYALQASAAGPNACSLYAVRMEVQHRLADAAPRPLEVTFRWQEVQPDRSLVERSHTERVTETPHRYTLNVGGADHPVMHSLSVNLEGAVADRPLGYSDGEDRPAERHVPQWIDYGRNLAEGAPYTVSVPSGTQWGAGDPEGTKLTDGIVGPPMSGGVSHSYGLLWTAGEEPVITVDLGQVERCGAFGIHVSGYPAWDAMRGEVEDEVEVLTSVDGEHYTSRGRFEMNLWWKDVPVNLMWPDDERFTAPQYVLRLPEPVEARFVRYAVTPRRFTVVSEVQVFDRVDYEPFDLRLALPDDPVPAEGAGPP